MWGLKVVLYCDVKFVGIKLYVIEVCKNELCDNPIPMVFDIFITLYLTPC